MFLAHISDNGVLILASIAAATYIVLTVIRLMFKNDNAKKD